MSFSNHERGFARLYKIKTFFNHATRVILMTILVKTIQSWTRAITLRFTEKTVPLALFFTLFIAFGLMVPQLGYYQDDWHHLYFGHSLGLPWLWKMFLYDGRPMAAALYIAGFSILGFTPLHWHISTFVLRFLTVLFTWLYLRRIWPNHKREVAWVALLFAVYPLFKLQPLSVAYTVHWASYLLFSISIWAMVESIRRPSKFWLFLGIALLANALHLFFIEYYSGVELIRPVILYLLLDDPNSAAQRFQKTLKQILKLWLPYLLVFIAFVVYRIYLIPSPEPGYERNIPTVLFDLFKSPFTTSILVLQNILQDTLFILVTIWGNVFTPDLFQITQSGPLKVIFFAAILGVLLSLYLKHLNFDLREAATASGISWSKPAFWLGFALLILGPVPAWMTGQSVSQDNLLWSGRLGMASMVGACLILVAGIERLIKNPTYRRAVFIVLITFACGWHILYTLNYRNSWIKQTQFYYQLSWRAPYLQPNTALLSDEEIFSYMGEYPTAFALGNVYPKTDPTMDVPYWFYSVTRRFPDQIDDLLTGLPFIYSKNFGRFNGNSLDSLVIYYAPEKKQCLWVIGPEDRELRVLPSVLREIAPISSLDRIEPNRRDQAGIPAEIFGPEPDRSWCYFYEKSALAAQYLAWDQVVALWKDATRQAAGPQNGVELLPFIKGFAYQGDWEQAQELTIRANKLTVGMKHTLCPLWEKFSSDTTASASRAEAHAIVNNKVGCGE